MNKSIFSEWHECLRSLLKEMRESAGLSQKQLGNAIGKHQSFVCKYENGERRLDVIELIWICQAMGVRFKDFLERFEAHCLESGGTLRPPDVQPASTGAGTRE